MRSVLQLAVLAVFVVLALTFIVNSMKRNTLFFPMPFPDGDWDTSALPVSPVDHVITTADGTRLHAWYFPSSLPSAPLAIWHHGNGGNISHRAPIAAELARRGISVFLYDYRGYGKSDGKPTEAQLYRDALKVVDYVRTTFPHTKLVAYGESLGGPYAAFTTAHRETCSAVIENSFHSAASVANSIYRLPIGVFLGNSLSTSRWLNASKTPTLVMHGVPDQVIPYRAGKALFDSLQGPKEMWTSQTAHHSELRIAEADEYYRRVVEFIRRHCPTS